MRPKKLTLIFLDYFNSSSGRYLLEFLMVAEQKSHLFDVRWLVESDDEVMLEKGNEFKYILSMPMKMVMVDQ